MKCRVCSAEIPEGKKCCPRCGRVLTVADMNTSQQDDVKASPLSDKTMVYRPASSGSSKPTDKTININDIFSSDPNAPVYSDPHTYDRATADALEYDRMFMSRRSDDDSDVKVFDPQPYSKRQNGFTEDEPQPYSQRKKNFTVEPEYDNYEDVYEEEQEAPPSRGTVIRDKKRAKPKFNFNIKYLIIALAVIAGLVVIVFGIYQLGQQFGIIGTSDEQESVVSGNSEEKTLKKNENSSVIDNSYTAQTGVYTVYSEQNNIFVYKSISDQRIIATIPNKTTIEITEINNGYGKTTYNSYTGWVDLDELKFTPNETPEQTTEASSAESTTLATYQPGTYTVTLNGSSTALNVRSTGSTSGEIINTLTEGTQVTVEEVKSSWGKIYIDDVEGWVYMEYLK